MDSLKSDSRVNWLLGRCAERSESCERCEWVLGVVQKRHPSTFTSKTPHLRRPPRPRPSPAAAYHTMVARVGTASPTTLSFERGRVLQHGGLAATSASRLQPFRRNRPSSSSASTRQAVPSFARARRCADNTLAAAAAASGASSTDASESTPPRLCDLYDVSDVLTPYTTVWDWQKAILHARLQALAVSSSTASRTKGDDPRVCNPY